MLNFTTSSHEIVSKGISFAVFCVGFYLFLFYRRSKKGANLPPGPKGLPLFGIFWDIYDYPAHLAYAEYGKTHGGILTVRIMRREIVVLNDVEHIREAMIQSAPTVDSRPKWRYCFIRLLRGLSVMPYTKQWVNTRRRAVSILRDYGMGKSFFEDKIRYEANYLIENILKDSDDGKANIDMNRRVRKAPVNVICSMLFNERYGYEDYDMEFILSTIEDLLTFLRTACVHDSLPVRLRPIVKYSLLEFHERLDNFSSFLITKVKKHEETYNDQIQRDFVDSWIKAEKSLTKRVNGHAKQDDNGIILGENGKHPSSIRLDEEKFSPLTDVLQDLLIAGAHSSGFALNWLIMLMTLHKDMQDEVYQAIMDCLGPDKVPTMSNRPQLPIVEAVIYETLRIGTLVPLVGHACTTDVTLSGYQIPAETEVTYNNWAVNYNEKNFPSAKCFKPHRWLNDEGKIDHGKTAKFFPFGIGKRSCAGEALAKMELFLSTTMLFQKLEFLLPDPSVAKTFSPEIKHVMSFVMEPKSYRVRVIRRTCNSE